MISGSFKIVTYKLLTYKLYIYFFSKNYWLTNLYIYIYIYIHIQDLVLNSSQGFIIIIILCRLHRYPWPSLATSPYRSSPPAGLQSYIPYPHIAAVCMFELVVLLLLGHMWGSIGVHHLWARLCFSSSVLRVWFV